MLAKWLSEDKMQRHKVLWEYCTQLKHSMSYNVLGTTNQAAMRQAAEDQ
jgi:hypothetical protein